MLQFKLKIDHTDGGWAKQRKHLVECNGEIAGHLYDNRTCESQSTNFVFFPYPSRISDEFSVGIDDKDRNYLLHAEGIRSDDMAEVLDMIRDWGETIDKRVAKMRDDFRKVLDAIPDRKFIMSKEAELHEGVKAKILKGSDHSFVMDLTWSELAKMYGSSYRECSEYQVTDCGVRGQAYGLKWQHMRKSPTISCVFYGGSSLLSIERSKDHMGAE